MIMKSSSTERFREKPLFWLGNASWSVGNEEDTEPVHFLISSSGHMPLCVASLWPPAIQSDFAVISQHFNSSRPESVFAHMGMSLIPEVEDLMQTKIVLAVICCAGCVGGDTISNRAVVPELGLAMDLPPNWYVDHDEPRMYMEAGKTDDNFGMIEDYPLDGMTLDAYVKDALENSIDAELLSNESMIISGKPAYISISRGRYTIMEANILQDDTVIRVWFRALPPDFDHQKDAFRAALEGIRVD